MFDESAQIRYATFQDASWANQRQGVYAAEITTLTSLQDDSVHRDP